MNNGGHSDGIWISRKTIYALVGAAAMAGAGAGTGFDFRSVLDSYEDLADYQQCDVERDKLAEDVAKYEAFAVSALALPAVQQMAVLYSLPAHIYADGGKE